MARLTAADRLAPAETWTVPVLSFTPQAMAAAWGVALLARGRGTVATAALAGAALTAAVVPRAVPRRQPDPTGPVLGLLTANLRTGRAAAGPLVELVRQTGADVLFVQELTESAVAGLHRAGLGELLPGQRLSPASAGGGGSGIYARYPLRAGQPAGPHRFTQATARLDLPAGWPCSLSGSPQERGSPAGQRPDSRPGPRELHLVCVHLPPPKPRSAGGAARWRGELAALPLPPGPGDPALILAGDYNATLDHAQFRRVLRRGYHDAASQVGLGLVPTWGPGLASGGGPALLALDHVLADPRCAVRGVSVYPLPGSDHRAVYAEVRLPG